MGIMSYEKEEEMEQNSNNQNTHIVKLIMLFFFQTIIYVKCGILCPLNDICHECILGEDRSMCVSAIVGGV